MRTYLSLLTIALGLIFQSQITVADDLRDGNIVSVNETDGQLVLTDGTGERTQKNSTGRQNHARWKNNQAD